MPDLLAVCTSGRQSSEQKQAPNAGERAKTTVERHGGRQAAGHSLYAAATFSPSGRKQDPTHN